MGSRMGWVDVFIFHFFITNHHKLTGLKHTHLSSQFLWIRILGVGELGFLLSFSLVELKVSAEPLSSFEPPGPLPSALVGDRIHFLVPQD